MYNKRQPWAPYQLEWGVEIKTLFFVFLYFLPIWAEPQNSHHCEERLKGIKSEQELSQFQGFLENRSGPIWKAVFDVMTVLTIDNPNTREYKLYQEYKKCMDEEIERSHETAARLRLEKEVESLSSLVHQVEAAQQQGADSVELQFGTDTDRHSRTVSIEEAEQMIKNLIQIEKDMQSRGKEVGR